MAIDSDRYVSLKGRKKRLDAELRAVNKEIEELNDQVVDQMVDAGIQRFTTAEGSTIYLSKTMMPSPTDGDYDRAYDALVDAGMANLAKKYFHWRSVQSALKELEKNGEPIPESFNGAIDIYEKITAAVLNAKE